MLQGSQVGVGNAAASSLTVVIPTRNEAGNVEPLLDRIDGLGCSNVERVVFVDDSADDTAEVARSLNGRFPFEVSVIHRPVGARSGGLGGAVVEGLKSVQTALAVVMDGDLQHPPETIRELLAAAAGGADLVVASRYIENGSAEGLGSAYRRFSSKAANGLVQRIFRAELAGVSDPMSGFFLVRIDRIDLGDLRPRGFKILMEIAVRNPSLEVADVGFAFGTRLSGDTKAGLREGFRYLRHVMTLRRQRARHTFLYEIHNHAGVRSTSRLPELERFRVGRLTVPVVIEVRTTWRPGAGLRRVDLKYREMLGILGFSIALEASDGRYRVEASPVLRLSPHVLYTNVVEPILRWALAERGKALIHAAVIERDGVCNLVTARTDTGKTTTMLQLLRTGRFRFMADDLVIAEENGRMWSYPKPLTISAHTLRAVNASRLGWLQQAGLPLQSRIHSRTGRKVAFALTRTRLMPVATVNTYVQMMIPPPKYHVETLLSDVETATTAQADRLYVIARGPRSRRILSPDEALSTLLANCEDAFGFPPYPVLEGFLRFQNGGDLMHDYRRIVSAVLRGRGAVELTSDDYDWAQTIAESVRRTESVVVDLRGEEPVVVVDSGHDAESETVASTDDVGTTTDRAVAAG